MGPRGATAVQSQAFSAGLTVNGPHRRQPQVSYSVLDRRAGLFLPPVCEKHGVQLLAYGTLAGGFLADRFLGLPASK